MVRAAMNGAAQIPTIHKVELWRRRVSRFLQRASQQPVVFVVGSGLSRDVWNSSER
jgi:hypothetical protein